MQYSCTVYNRFADSQGHINGTATDRTQVCIPIMNEELNIQGHKSPRSQGQEQLNLP